MFSTGAATVARAEGVADRRPDEITVAEAARILGITTAQLGRLQKSGHVPRTRRGYTALIPAAAGFVRFLAEEINFPATIRASVLAAPAPRELARLADHAVRRLRDAGVDPAILNRIRAARDAALVAASLRSHGKGRHG